MYEWSGKFLYKLLKPIWGVMVRRTNRVRVLIEHQDEILIIRNWFGSGRWTLPGGGIRNNESPEQAAKRELFEELQIEADVSDFKKLKTIEESELAGYKVVGLKLTIHARDFVRNKKELTAAKWAHPDKLPENSNPLIRKLID